MSHSLDHITLLADLPAPVRQALAARCRWQVCQPDDYILAPDKADTDIYFIVRGSVRVTNVGSNGKEISFAELKAGDCFGELSAIDGKPRSAGILAQEPTHVASLSAADLQAVMLEHPEVSLALLRKVVAMLREASGRILSMSTVQAHTRVYAELLRQAKLLQNSGKIAPGQPLILKPAPIHSDIGARISATRETVARAFAVLIKQDIIRRVRGGLEILDMAALTELAEG